MFLSVMGLTQGRSLSLAPRRRTCLRTRLFVMGSMAEDALSDADTSPGLLGNHGHAGILSQWFHLQVSCHEKPTPG